MGVRTIALQERAEELGYETIQEAIDAGYYVGYRANGDHYLYKPDEQELAHEAWLERKLQVVHNLETLREKLTKKGDNESIKNAIIIGDAILFIKEGEV